MLARRTALILALLMLGCDRAPELEPSRSEARAGDWISLRGHELGSRGAAIVTFAGVAAHPVVIESDALIRTRVPSLPLELEGQAIDVVISFADGSELRQPEVLRYVSGPLVLQPVQGR